MANLIIPEILLSILRSLPSNFKRSLTEKVMENRKTICVCNYWHQEGGCSGGDGYSEIKASFSSSCEENAGFYEESEELSPGQYVLITWLSNTGYSCCSGYNRATLEVFDEEPDLTGEEYPEENYYGDHCEYEIKTYEEFLDEITDS